MKPLPLARGGASDRVIFGQRSDRPIELDLLLIDGRDFGSLLAGRARALAVDVGEAGRRIDIVGAFASGKSIPQPGQVNPANDKVVVEAVAGEITHHVDKVVVSVGTGVVEPLVEDLNDGDRMGLGGRHRRYSRQ